MTTTPTTPAQPVPRTRPTAPAPPPSSADGRPADGDDARARSGS